VGFVVTGIAQTTDIRPLEAALQNAGLSLDPIQLITADEEDLGGVQAPATIDDALIGEIGTGTGVPGISTKSSSTLPTAGSTFFRNESLSDRLGDLEIPDDEIDNYIEALEAGRSVVAYFAKETNVAQVEGAFRNSGLAKIKVF
jgi:hypothetical protein